MEYCLDSNVFIQAKNYHYQFEICPGFWNWLDQENGNVGSISHVCVELENGDDALKDWVVEIKQKGFFVSSDNSSVQEVFAEISAYVVANYKPHVASSFLSGADPWLVAFSKVHDLTLVTHESYNPLAKRKVLIPNICEIYGVSYTDCYTMLRSLGASFVLEE